MPQEPTCSAARAVTVGWRALLRTRLTSIPAVALQMYHSPRLKA